MKNIHPSGRYLVSILACAGFFVAGMAVDRCFANPVVAEAQASEYLGISSCAAIDSSGRMFGIYILKSNGDVEAVDPTSNLRVLHKRADAKIENAKEIRLREIGAK